MNEKQVRGSLPLCRLKQKNKNLLNQLICASAIAPNMIPYEVQVGVDAKRPSSNEYVPFSL